MHNAELLPMIHDVILLKNISYGTPHRSVKQNGDDPPSIIGDAVVFALTRDQVLFCFPVCSLISCYQYC